MTNKNSPIGAKAIDSIVCAPFNLRIHKYYVPDTDSDNIYINDCVKTTGVCNSDGVAIIAKAAAGESMRGVVVSIKNIAETETFIYREGSTERVVYVCDDPNVILEMQVNGTLTTSDVGKTADIVVANGSAATGVSGTQIDLTTLASTDKQMKILDVVDRLDNALGLYSKVRCLINLHELGGASGGGSDFWDRTGTTISPHTAGDDVALGTGDLSATDGTFAGDVSGVNGTFTGDVGGVNGTFTGDISGVGGTFTGNIGAVDGVFTGDISSVNAHFTGKLTVDGLIDPTAIILSGQTSVPTTDDGSIYYNQDIGRLVFRENGDDKYLTGDLWGVSVKDEIDFTSAEPAAPSEGDRYINDTTGISSVTGQSVTENYIYDWNGTDWTETSPDIGLQLWDIAADNVKLFDGTNWVISGGIWKKIGTTISPMSSGDDLEINDIVINSATQDYIYSGRTSTGNLYSQCLTSGAAYVHEMFTKDGDETDSLRLKIFGEGTPSSLSNISYLSYGFNAADHIYFFNTLADGTGTLRDIKFEVGSNTDQLHLHNTNGTIGIGTANNSFNLNGTTYYSKIFSEAANTSAYTFSSNLNYENTTAAYGAKLMQGRARGTPSSASIVQNGDTLSTYGALGYDSAKWLLGASIDSVVDGVAALNDMPTRWNFYVTASGSATPSLAASIRQDRLMETFGNHKWWISSSETYSSLHYYAPSHDDISLGFDAYYDSGWKSSDAGSNFRFNKSGDIFSLQVDDSIAAGSGITWNNAITFSKEGYCGFLTNSVTYTVTGTTHTGINTLKINNDSGAAAHRAILQASSVASNGVVEEMLRSRGTIASPTIVSDGDEIYSITGYGYDGTDYVPLAQMRMEVKGGTGENDMPGRIIWAVTENASDTLTDRMGLTFNGWLGVGTIAPRSQLDVNGAETLRSMAEPSDPADDNCILWLSNGTGVGDNGDLMLKITISGTTKTTTLADYSAL